MTDFEDARVVVEEIDDVNWEVRQSFDYEAKSETFHVPVGQRTDFASVPRVFVWFLPRYGRYTKAAILHDYLWRELASKGKIEYIDADGIFRRALRDLEVPFLTRWILWGAVRVGALVKPGGRKGWLREAPRVLLIAILVLPVVLPAAIVVAITLIAFYLIEVVVWVPLKLAEKVKMSKSPATAKRANLPRITWKT